MNLTPNKRQVFLSHSGLDAQWATKLAAALEQRLTELGHDIEVFNTSEPEHRYKDLQKMLAAGEDWRAQAEQYEEELRVYLSQNLERSSAFILLVTFNSLMAESNVIQFEINTARSAAMRTQKLFFFPCVSGGVSLRDLPLGAMEFQGIELDSKEGLARLIEAVQRALIEE